MAEAAGRLQAATPASRRGLLFPLQERIKKHHSVALRARARAHPVARTRRRSRPCSSRGCAQFLARRRPRRCRTTSACSPSTASTPPLSIRSPTSRGCRSSTRRGSAPTSRPSSRAAAGPLVKYNTGGSSGEPLVFYMGMGRVSHDVAAKWRATRWWGVDIGDPEIVLWGSPVELTRQDRYRALRDRLFRTYLLPAFQMSPQQMDDYCRQIRRIAAAHGVRVRVGGGAAGPARAKRAASGSTTSACGSCSRPARRCIPTSGKSSSACSARPWPTATARATRASSRTSARRARCTCRPRTSSSSWWTPTVAPLRRGRAAKSW